MLTRQLYHTVGLPESAIRTIQTSSAVFNEKWPFFLQVLRQLDFPKIDLPKIRLLQTYITQHYAAIVAIRE